MKNEKKKKYIYIYIEKQKQKGGGEEEVNSRSFAKRPGMVFCSLSVLPCDGPAVRVEYQLGQ